MLATSHSVKYEHSIIFIQKKKYANVCLKIPHFSIIFFLNLSNSVNFKETLNQLHCKELEEKIYLNQR